MAGTRSFPTLGAAHRPRFSPVDVVVFVAVALLLFGVLRLAHAMNASTTTAHAAVISTSPYQLPYDARAILRALETTQESTLDERFFLDLLERGFGEEEARAQLGTAIRWGRYAELFDYAADDRTLSLTR